MKELVHLINGSVSPEDPLLTYLRLNSATETVLHLAVTVFTVEPYCSGKTEPSIPARLVDSIAMKQGLSTAFSVTVNVWTGVFFMLWILMGCVGQMATPQG